MQFRFGTQSWLYPQWNGVFYDSQTQPARQLEGYTRHFDFVEVDTTFYGAPSSNTIARWYKETPKSFLFSPKMPREITHERTFIECETQVAAFFERMLELGEKLGPVLVQLPPSLEVSALTRIIDRLALRPSEIRCALEFRHRSWFTPTVFEACESCGIAVAAVDAPFIPLPFAHRTVLRATADFVYVRLLGERDDSLPFNVRLYDKRLALRSWAERIRDSKPEQAFITTSNYYEGFAPETAFRIAAELGEARPPGNYVSQTSLF